MSLMAEAQRASELAIVFLQAMLNDDYVCTYGCVYRLAGEAAFSSDVSEKTDSDSTVVTVVNCKSNSSFMDDTQSLFSVDQDGFFTSMHADSGLMVQTNSLHPEFGSLTDSNCGKNTSVVTTSCDKHSPGGSVSVTALSLQLSSLNMTDSRLDESGTVQRSSRMLMEKYRSAVQSPLSVQSVLGAFPSFCTVTPPSSDDEIEAKVTDKTDSCSEYKARNILSPSATVSTPLPPGDATSRHDTPSDLSLINYYTLPKAQSNETMSTESKFLTWPCSPVSGSKSSMRGILKSKSYGTKSRQPHQKLIEFFSPVTSPAQEASYNCRRLTVNSDSSTDKKAPSTASATFDRNQERSVDNSNSESNLSQSATLNQTNYSTLLTEHTPSEEATISADGAATLSAAETSSSVDPSGSDAGRAAVLVISSPVLLQSTYVENTHRRFICRPLRPDEWHRLACRNQWSNTLPTNLGRISRTLDKTGTERRRKRVNTEVSNLQRKQQSGKVQSGSRVGTAEQNSSSVLPSTMLHSPRRYGIDGYCRENNVKLINSLASEQCAERELVSCSTVDVKTAVMNSAVTVRPKNMKKMRNLNHSSDVLLQAQVAREGQVQQKSVVELMPQDDCKRENAQVVGNDFSKSSACQQDNSGKSNAIQLPAADFEPANSRYSCTCVDFDQTISTDAVINGGMEVFDITYTQTDLLPINSATVYNVRDGGGSIAQSSDSISSTLSAAERSRAAKLAFLGFSVNDNDQLVVNSTHIDQNTCAFATRSDDTNSSSGLGSSVSGSPIVSPEEDTSDNLDETSVQQQTHASCRGIVSEYSKHLLLDCPLMYKRTLSRTDCSKQTAV